MRCVYEEKLVKNRTSIRLTIISQAQAYMLLSVPVSVPAYHFFCLSAYPLVFRYILLFVCPSVCLSVNVCNVCLPDCLSISVCLHLCFRLYLSAYLSVSLHVLQFLYVLVDICMCLSVSSAVSSGCVLSHSKELDTTGKPLTPLACLFVPVLVFAMYACVY